jgi:hypothetical protein
MAIRTRRRYSRAELEKPIFFSFSGVNCSDIANDFFVGGDALSFLPPSYIVTTSIYLRGLD